MSKKTVKLKWNNNKGVPCGAPYSFSVFRVSVMISVLICSLDLLPQELTDRLDSAVQEIRGDILPTLIRYYIANKPYDTDWVVLPAKAIFMPISARHLSATSG